MARLCGWVRLSALATLLVLSLVLDGQAAAQPAPPGPGGTEAPGAPPTAAPSDRPPPPGAAPPSDDRRGPGEPSGLQGPRGRRPPPIPMDRVPDTSAQWMVRFLLFPVTCLFFGLAGYGLWRARKVPGLKAAAVLCVLMGLGTVWPVLRTPSEHVLLRDLAFRDATGSMELIASLQDALPRLSDVTLRFSFPEGASWLQTGPAWLAYIVVQPLAWIVGPVAAHNLGVGLLVGLMGLCAWGLALSLGASPITAMLAAAGSILAPAILAELDTLSLDRITLGLTPVFFLCLNRAADQKGWRWPVAAGAALAAVFYGQTYYGLYLAAACPLLVVPRLIGPEFSRRLLRMALLAGVALALIAPGLYVLDQSTRNTNYERVEAEKSFISSTDNLLRPFDPEEVGSQLHHYMGDNFPMREPLDRLKAAIAHAVPYTALIKPTDLLSGNSLFWAYVLLALAIAVRRRPVLLCALDVLILMVFAMGPFLRTQYGLTTVPLPYYAYFVAVPGFEQLKNISRFILLAASISTVPLALGLSAIAERFERRKWTLPRPVLAAIVAGLAFALPCLHLPDEWFEPPPPEDGSRPPRPPHPVVTYPKPIAVRFPRVQALEALKPGPVLLLPIVHPIPVPARVAVLQQNLPTVNKASFGSRSRTRLPVWFDDNPFLNQLCHASGSNRARQHLHLDNPRLELERLARTGLRYVVVFRHQMLQSKSESAERFLGQYLEKVADDGNVAVYAIPMAEEKT